MLKQIIDYTKALIQKINPEKKWLWIVLFLGINFSHLALFHHFVINREEGKLYALGGDGDQYVGATESLLANGEMTFMKSNEHLFYSNLLPQDEFDLGMYYAFRTPGFVFVHLPLRWFFNLHTSLNIFIILQTIVNAVAKFLLCLLFYRIFNSKVLFLALVIGFVLAIQLSFWNNHLMTESFGVSFLVMSIYYLHQALKNQSKLNFFISGLLITLAIHFRPFIGSILFVYLLILIFNTKFNLKGIVIYSIFLFSSFGIIHGSWIIRNYMKTDKIILVADTQSWSSFTNKAFNTNRTISRKLNLSPLWWENESPTYFFENSEDTRNPLELYGEKFFVDLQDTIKLKKAKEYYIKSNDKFNYTLEKRQYFELKADGLLNNIYSKYLNYNSVSNFEIQFKTLLELLNNQPLYKPFISIKYPFNVITVFIESFVNRLIFTFGIIMCFISFFLMRKDIIFIAIGFISCFIVIYFARANYIEIREYYIPSFFALALGVYGLYYLIKRKKHILLSLVLVGVLSLSIMDCIDKIQW